MKRKFLGVTLILISVTFSQFVINKLDNKITNRSNCSKEILTRLDELKTQIPPYKLVIQPWNGRHNVHAIFMLPIEERSPKMLILQIPGAGTFCGGGHNVGTSFEGIQAKPGYYLVKANLRTRTAIWLIVRGFAEQLEESGNWRLINRHST